MESLLPPDPYKALGVARDADIALIKKTFRKLALSCHPDKLPAGIDESLKQKKQEEFHKINQAYELIGDESARQRYDDEYKLEQLRSEKLARGGAKVSERAAGSYGIRTQAPASAAGDAYAAKTSRDYETRKPARAATYDDRYDDRSRKYDPYEGSSYTKPKTTSRSSREEIPIKIVRSSTDRTRSDHKKSRDKEERRERERRFVAPESDSDEKRAYERDWKRRSDDATRAKEEDELRRKAAEARKKAEEGRRSYDDKYDRQGRRSDDDKYDRPDRERKISENVNEAVRHIYRSRVEAERPSPSRTSSSRDVPQYYESRSRRDRPEAPRRSSARPKDSPTSGRERDRKGYEIVDWDSGDAKLPPSFSKSSSSPAEIHVPRATPQRSYTESSREHRRDDTSPTPKFRRSATMDSRRAEAPVTRPSGLRESVTAYSRNSSPESYPQVPPPASRIKSYRYDTPGGGVRLTEEDVGIANNHRAVLREPETHRKRSTSPGISRPPMGVNRPSDPSSSYGIPVVAPRGAAPPPLSRSATTAMNVKPVRASEERNRDLYYGEIPSSKDRRENRGRQPTSFAQDQVSYSKPLGPEDIQWSPYTTRGRDGGVDRDREFTKPGLSRASTSVY
jgi:curved DNA-binding protein CbpA